MELPAFMVFVALSLAFCAVPGPNVLVVISTTLSEGRAKGFKTIFGISIAMALQLAIAALGTTWLVESLAKGFLWLKWCGVAYLIYLGIGNFLKLLDDRAAVPESTTIDLVGRGFLVSLTNPKTILFFGAFLPQFATATSSYPLQIAILSIVFWLSALAVNVSYAVLSGRLSIYLATKRFSRIKHASSGALYLGAGVLLASSKRV